MEAAATYAVGGANLLVSGRTGRIALAVVSPDFFNVFAVRPTIGGRFSMEDQVWSDQAPAIISAEARTEFYPGKEAPVGEELVVNGDRYVVAGVMPKGFNFPGHAAVWIPVRRGGKRPELGRDHADQVPPNMLWWGVVGRLRPGATAASVQPDLDYLRGELERLYPNLNFGRVRAKPLREFLLTELKRPMIAMAGAGALILAICLANLVALMLARAGERRREMALRVAFGSSRGEVISRAVARGMVLAVAAWLLSLVPATAGTSLLRVAIAGKFNGPANLSLDVGSLAGAFVLSAAVAVAAAIGTSLGRSRIDIWETLKAQGHTLAGDRGRAQTALIIAEVAITFILCVGAGLLVQTASRLRATALGFRPQKVATAALALPAKQYPDLSAAGPFQAEILHRTGAVPGVEAAGLVTPLPLSPVVAGCAYIGPFDGTRKGVCAFYSVFAGEYLSAMGIPLLAGRSFRPTDAQGAPPVAIINDVAAAGLFPGGSATGQALRVQPERGAREIVGVVGGVASRALGTAGEPQLYLPYLQPLNNRRPGSNFAVVVRASAEDPRGIIPFVRAAIQAVDPTIPLFDVGTMENLVERSAGPAIARANLVLWFAVTAIVLAFFGVYGVVSYSVARRKRDIGVRMALGGRPASILILILRGTLVHVSAGLAIGCIAAVALARTIDSMLFGIRATDLRVFLGAGALVSIGALAAAARPAWSASRIQPLSVLKDE